MNRQLVTINGRVFYAREYRDQRVLTYGDIDSIHRLIYGTTKRKVNQARDIFTEGIDFFRVFKCDYGENFNEVFGLCKNVSNCVVLTKLGYLKVVDRMLVSASDKDEVCKLYFDRELPIIGCETDTDSEDEIPKLGDIMVYLSKIHNLAMKTSEVVESLVIDVENIKRQLGNDEVLKNEIIRSLRQSKKIQKV